MSFMNTLNAAACRLKPAFIHPSRRLFSLRHISEESEARYCIGGYHPLRLGDSFNHGRYKIISKLGYGRYSTVWLVFDHEQVMHLWEAQAHMLS